MMRENPNVCFEVDRMEDLANWRSVIGWGKYEELDGSVADHAVATLFARLLPMTVTSETSFPPKDLTHQHRVQVQGLRTVIFRIRLTEVTGRFETR
jgi:nitroimidazol reductase NimA-like FMN-containing flavoprotein (pyridoxamine 5'-phosphate oxidase superfamily)